MTPKCKEYRDRILTAFECGNDTSICEIHAELNEDMDLWIEVWGCLPSTMRRQIKEIVDREDP
jgi:hypothetical protein